MSSKGVAPPFIVLPESKRALGWTVKGRVSTYFIAHAPD